MSETERPNLPVSRRGPARRALLAIILGGFFAAGAVAQEPGVFPTDPEPRYGSSFDADLSGFRLADLERPLTWADEGEFRLGGGVSGGPIREPEAAGESPAPRRCVLFQCVRPAADAPPPSKLFTAPVSIWTGAALLGGFIDGIQGPIKYGFGSFHFTDEGFFQSWTYSGGSDKASHFVISANVGGLLYDAYTLNRLTPDQAFWLSLATMVVSGTLVEIGDGLTPYGFSAQDLTADTLGALAGSLIHRNRLDDLVGVRLGEVPTTIPAAVTDGHEAYLGADYSHEVYTADLKFDGLFERMNARPGAARFFLFSFAYLTKGYGYVPPIPSRYQEVGLEVGLNFPEILRAVGVNETTWWGDTLLRVFRFLRIPYTQIGAYYNLANRKWYGPGAPYQYY